MSSRFCGRETQLREIVSGTMAARPVSYSIIGPDYVGKSRLLRDLAAAEWLPLDTALTEHGASSQEDPIRIATIYLNCADRDTGTHQHLLSNLTQALSELLGDQRNDIGRGDMHQSGVAPAEAMLKTARLLHQHGLLPIILLDNFDDIFAESEAATPMVNGLVSLLANVALVVATQQPLHDLGTNLDPEIGPESSPGHNSDHASIELSKTLTPIFLGLIEANVARTWIAEAVERSSTGRSATGQPSTETGIVDLLLTITGRHPYLIHSIDGVLAEVQHFLTGNAPADKAIMALVRLRLAEHGRPLFLAQWTQLLSQPAHVPGDIVERLLHRLLHGPLDLATLSPDEGNALNWLFNQAVVTWDESGCRLYSPLFVDFLKTQMETTEPQLPPADALPEHVPDLPIYDRLTKTEVSLLRYFQQHSQKIVPPEQLLADVWRRPDASPRRVQEAIRRLRLQLADADPPVGVIENERGRGYRFVPSE